MLDPDVAGGGQDSSQGPVVAVLGNERQMDDVAHPLECLTQAVWLRQDVDS